MTEDKSRRMVGLLVPASDDDVVAMRGWNYYPTGTRWLHLAGWFDRVIFSLTGMCGSVQLIISIGSIRQESWDQTIESNADREGWRAKKNRARRVAGRG